MRTKCFAATISLMCLVLLQKFGIDQGTAMCQRILETGDMHGLHMYTLNMEASAVAILENLGLINEQVSCQHALLHRMPPHLLHAWHCLLSQQFTWLVDRAQVPRTLPWRAPTNVNRKEENVRPIHWCVSQQQHFPMQRHLSRGTNAQLWFESLLETIFCCRSNRPKAYLKRTADWDRFPTGRWGNARRSVVQESGLKCCMACRAMPSWVSC